MIMLPGCACCGCSESCCRTRVYSYADTTPPGKWYDECPGVGGCSEDGKIGDCADVVIDGFIIERFCKQSTNGKEIRAKLLSGSSLDDFGEIAGIKTTKSCGTLGYITGDHYITSEIVVEDDPDDSQYVLAKVPITATNSPTLGGPCGAASVRICWCCATEGSPPCDCCGEIPPPNGCCCINGNMSYGVESAAECADLGGDWFPTCPELPLCDPGCGYREYCSDEECVLPTVTVSYCGLTVSENSASGPPESATPFSSGGAFGGYHYGLGLGESGLTLNPGYKLILRCNSICIETVVYIAIESASRTYRCQSCINSGSVAVCELISESPAGEGLALPCPEPPLVLVNWAP